MASDCIQQLKEDHETILSKLAELEGAVSPLSIDKKKVAEFLKFTENFAEPHHRKEEKVLFPALEEKGIPNQGGPIGMMLMEHEAKRGHVRDLSGALEKDDENQIRESARAIISLLREHIDKENNVLYPCASDALSAEELDELASRCQEIK